jgi:plasmid stability protein
MPTMIQIRNVPDPVHRRIKARAQEEGLSMSAYLLREIDRVARRPSRRQLLRRIASRSRVEPSVPAADVIRQERERREG